MFVLRILRGVAMGVILSIAAVVAIITKLLFWVIAMGAVIVTCSHPFIRAARFSTNYH